jgi:hypothetical protein
LTYTDKDEKSYNRQHVVVELVSLASEVAPLGLSFEYTSNGLMVARWRQQCLNVFASCKYGEPIEVDGYPRGSSTYSEPLASTATADAVSDPY